MGRLLLRFLPWWVFVLAALAFLPVTLAGGRDLLASRAAFSVAQASPAPAAVGIGAFDPARDVSPLGEVRITGIWLRALGTGSIVKDGVDDAYIVLKDAAGPDYAVLFFRDFDKASVESGLQDLTEFDGQITVAGFHEPGTLAMDRVTADLKARNLAAGPPMLLLEPYFGDRAAALRSRQTTDIVTFAVIAGVNLILLLIAVFKLRARRARIPATRANTGVPRVRASARRPVAPQPTPAPRTTGAKPVVAPAKSADRFADSPIQSPKGWFR